MNKIISLILIATMVFSFAGCSSKETKATTKETTKQSSTTTKKEKTTTSKSSNITTKQTTESGTKSTGGATAKVEAKTTTGTTKSVPGESATVETKTTTTTTQTEHIYTLEEAYAYRDRLKAYAISIGLKWNENITEDIGAGVGEYLAISPKRDINYHYEKHCNDIKCAAESDGYHEINIIVTPEGRPGYYCLNNLFW